MTQIAQIFRMGIEPVAGKWSQDLRVCKLRWLAFQRELQPCETGWPVFVFRFKQWTVTVWWTDTHEPRTCVCGTRSSWRNLIFASIISPTRWIPTRFESTWREKPSFRRKNGRDIFSKSEKWLPPMPTIDYVEELWLAEAYVLSHNGTKFLSVPTNPGEGSACPMIHSFHCSKGGLSSSIPMPIQR